MVYVADAVQRGMKFIRDVIYTYSLQIIVYVAIELSTVLTFLAVLSEKYPLHMKCDGHKNTISLSYIDDDSHPGGTNTIGKVMTSHK